MKDESPDFLVNPNLTRGGASEAHFTFFLGKSPHIPVYFIQRIQNKPHLKIWYNILKSLHYNFAFSKI